MTQPLQVVECYIQETVSLKLTYLSCKEILNVTIILFVFYLHCPHKCNWRFIQTDGMISNLPPKVDHPSSGMPLGSSPFELCQEH